MVTDITEIVRYAFEKFNFNTRQHWQQYDTYHINPSITRASILHLSYSILQCLLIFCHWIDVFVTIMQRFLYIDNQYCLSLYCLQIDHHAYNACYRAFHTPLQQYMHLSILIINLNWDIHQVKLAYFPKGSALIVRERNMLR